MSWLMCCRANSYEDEEDQTEKRRWCMRILVTLLIIIVIIGIVLATVLYRSNKHRLQLNDWDSIMTNNGTGGEIPCGENIRQGSIPDLRSNTFAEHPFCAETGKKILLEGGSAVDAGISMLFCQGVVEPHRSGLGGGFLMMIYLHETREVVTLDAQGTAPFEASATMFGGPATDEIMPEAVNIQRAYRQGWLTVTIPGEPLGLWEAHKKYGKLPWDMLVEPAIRLASHGFPVSKSLAAHCSHFNDTIEKDAYLKKMFTNAKTHQIYSEGDDIHNQVLAKMLIRIAKNGVDYIYTGDGSIKIVDECIDKGGIAVRQDFADYKVKWSRSLPYVFNDYGDRVFTLHIPPPPSCAIIIAMILNIFHGCKLHDNDNALIYRTDYYHKVVEAMKHSFATKHFFGDSSEIATKDVLKYLKLQWRMKIQNLLNSSHTFPANYYMKNISNSGLPDEDFTGCSIGAIASNGDAIVASSSLNDPFGAGVVSETFGFLLNNYMFSFSRTVNQHAEKNFASPGKRPVTSMSPIMVLDGQDNFKLMMVASGGTRIPTSLATILIEYFCIKNDLTQAMAKLRFHHQLVPNVILYKGPPKEQEMEYLRTYGHKLNMTECGWPQVKAIVYENETLSRLSDTHDIIL